MSAVIVTAAVAVLPTVDGREQYLYEGAIFDSDGITEKGLEHARAQGLIDDAPEFVEDEEPLAVFSQDDVEAAVKAATEAKDAELAEVRKAVEDRDTEIAKQAEELAAARAEAAKSEAPKVPASKSTAAKQS